MQERFLGFQLFMRGNNGPRSDSKLIIHGRLLRLHNDDISKEKKPC